MRKNIFACLFSIHNTISLSRHEQVCLSGHLGLSVESCCDNSKEKITND